MKRHTIFDPQKSKMAFGAGLNSFMCTRAKCPDFDAPKYKNGVWRGFERLYVYARETSRADNHY